MRPYAGMGRGLIPTLKLVNFGFKCSRTSHMPLDGVGEPASTVVAVIRAAAWLSPTHPVASAKPPAGQPNTNPTARTAVSNPLVNHNRRNCAISHTIHGGMTANHGPSKAGNLRPPGARR